MVLPSSGGPGLKYLFISMWGQTILSTNVFFVVYFSVFSHIRCAIEEPNQCFSSGLSACPLSRAKSLRHSEITRENISNFMTNFRYTKNQSWCWIFPVNWSWFGLTTLDLEKTNNLISKAADTSVLPGSGNCSPQGKLSWGCSVSSPLHLSLEPGN